MRTAVVTIASGRHDHLAAQSAALARSDVAPHAHVVVAMDDPQIEQVVPGADVVHVPRVDGRLPLAAARNAGVGRARALAPPHPARPAPADDEVLPNHDPDLFWSLSFALTPATWDRVGGFCEDYTGYGGEDTDFGWSAVAGGVDLWWAGGAWAFHQHHGPGGPPEQHLHDVVRNAGVFHDRHGSWPMQGWLDDFARQGLARFDGPTGRWVVA